MTGPFIRRTASTALIAASLVASATAQPSPQAFADAQRANQSALRQHVWKSRTELRVEGDVKQVRLEQVRFDLDGRLQKTAIGGETAAPSSRPGPPGPAGVLKKHVVARKTEAFKDMLADLGRLAESYAHLPSDRLQALSRTAVITPGHGLDGAARLVGQDVLMPGDRLTAWIDPKSLSMRRIEIASVYEGSTVTITADYRRLGDGLTYQARSVLRYAARHVEVSVENFDYTPALGD